MCVSALGCHIKGSSSLLPFVCVFSLGCSDDSCVSFLISPSADAGFRADSVFFYFFNFLFFSICYLLLIVRSYKYSWSSVYLLMSTSTKPLFMKYIPKDSSPNLIINSEGRNRNVVKFLTMKVISMSEQPWKISTFFITLLWSLNNIWLFKHGESNLKNLFRSKKTSGVSLMYYR